MGSFSPWGHFSPCARALKRARLKRHFVGGAVQGRREPNLVLRDLMGTRRFTREGLADEICATALKLTGKPVACTARHVARWLSGEVLWPWGRYRTLLEAVFELPVEHLGFLPPPGYRRAMAPPPTPSIEEPPLLRRHFIVGLGAVLTLPSLPTAGRLGLADVGSIRAAVSQLHAMDDLHGGAELAAVSAGYADHVEQAARNCTYGGVVQKSLHRAVGELAASAGWFAYDGGQQDKARRWWDMGIRYAVLAGDTTLQARIWSYMARQACDLGHGSEAVAISRVALDATRNRREPRLSALLHARVALGHSLNGEGARSAQSLHRADTMLDRAPEGERTSWLSFCGPAEISGQVALCEFNLGRYKDAASRDIAALSLMPEGFDRNGFATQISLARNQFAAGNAEEALNAGTRALALLPTVKSPRWARHLAKFAQDVQHRNPAGASEFAQRYEVATR